MKNVKLYEKLKGKAILVTASIATGVIAMSGCTNEPVVTPQPTEVVSEEPSIEIIETSEEPTEEISEEPVVEELDYSVEAITKIGDEISNDVKYLTRDQIDSFIIAANLDHISEEDLETLLSTDGYTLESLNDSYIAGLKTMTDMYINHRSYMVGDEYSQEKVDMYYDEKIDFSKIIIDEKFDELENVVDKLYYKKSEDYSVLEGLSLSNSEEKTMYDIVLGGTGFDIDYDKDLNNPYLDLINAKIK